MFLPPATRAVPAEEPIAMLWSPVVSAVSAALPIATLSPPGLEPSKLSKAVKPNAIFLEPSG